MKLLLTEEARAAVANAGFDPEYGARPLRRVIQNEIQDELSEAILANRYVPGDVIQVDYREAADEEGEMAERFVFDVIEHAPVEENDTETTDAIAAMLQ
jgi:ATP-dependent Clp protease ATP-binding subunit ClpA